MAVSQYIDNSEQVLDLHKQMQECDSVLARMQEMLLGFQADLGGISEEIRHLQDESLSMSIRLKNRRAAEEKLSKFLYNSNVTHDMVAAIVSSEVNDQFLDAVVNVSKRFKYLQQTTPSEDGSSLDLSPADTHVARSLLPDLERLRMRIISKTRDYFSAQFTALKKSKTNVHILQQNSLVRYAPLMQFLQAEAPAVADDIQVMYTEYMGRILQNLFKSYTSQLNKLEVAMASKTDLIAIDDTSLKSMFTQRINVNKKYESFSLGDRESILGCADSEPILLHVAFAEGAKYPYEAIMRSVIKHLNDAATNEFLFIIDFFKINTRDTFNRIFGRSLSLVLENLENYLLSCHDIVGLLLMIKVTHNQRMVMQRRRIPILDSFFDRISMLLWPRFKQVFDLNMKSVRTANVKKLGPVELSPHYVSRRYAELVASLLTLQGGGADGVSRGDCGMGVGGGGEIMLHNDVQMLRQEMTALLERLALLIPDLKERRVFLINNYDQILTVFHERQLISEEVQKFDDLLMQQREFFAEEEIKSSFPSLIAFVVRTELAIVENAVYNSSGATTNPDPNPHPRGASFAVDESAVEALVSDFASNWRAGIQQINDDVMAYFANFRNGMEILKQALTQLLLYYTRFQDIIKKSFPKASSLTKDVVSTSAILLEIKRYSRTF